VKFADRATCDLYNGIASKRARSLLPAALVRRAIDKLTILEAAVSLEQLRVPPGNRLEALRGERAGQHSIRVNDQYRICFRWTDAGPAGVEIVDYH
jgi:proteic killer suppression protein